MSKKPPQKTGGSSCAVATCTHYGSKAKRLGLNLSFHRFPKDPKQFKVWEKQCRRVDKLNSKTSFICSDHFTPDSFVRDLKAELLGYKPKNRMLKPNAVPTLNLTANTQKVKSIAAINRAKKMEARSIKQAHDELIASILDTSTSIDPLPPSPTVTITPIVEEISDNSYSENMDYKQLYYELLKNYNDLKDEHDKQEMKLQNQSEDNERLQTHINILEDQLNLKTNLVLNNTEKCMSEKKEKLSPNTKKSAENESKKSVPVFSQNQSNLLQNSKKHVCWTKDQLMKAFTLRYLSFRAYVFVKDHLQYPLPGVAFLEQWSKTIKRKDGILHDML